MVLDPATTSSFGPNVNANEIAAATSSMGTFRRVELTLFSANGLPNLRTFLPMKVYAKVSLEGVVETEKKTPVDTEGGTNPCWNEKMVYVAEEAMIHNERAVLKIQLYCARSIKHDKYVGEVNLSLKQLFDQGTSSAERHTYKVYKCKNGCKAASGSLDLSCAFGELLSADEVVPDGNPEDQVRCGKVTLKKAGDIFLTGVKIALALGMVIVEVV